MHYKIGDWLINTAETTIKNYKTEVVVKLEPIAVELLLLLANNSNKIVTRDEMISSVWNNKAVTDNAIYRVITKLRKALSEQDKNAYIITVPKRGYKLIHDVQALENISSFKQKSISNLIVSTKEDPNSASKLLVTLFIISGLILLSWLAYFIIQADDDIQRFNKSKPLTSDVGAELEGLYIKNSTSNQNLLFYTYINQAQTTSNIYLKDLNNQEIHQITDTEASEANLSVSQDGESFVATRHENGSCEIILFKKSANYIYHETSLFSCNPDIVNLAISSDSKDLYFTDSKITATPQIYSYKLLTGKVKQLTHLNKNNSLGERLISLSPDDSKLAFVRYLDWENSEVGIINLEKQTERILFTKKGIIHSIAWSNDSNYIFYKNSTKNIHAYSLVDKKSREVISVLTGSLGKIFTSPIDNSLIVENLETTRGQGISQVVNPLELTSNTINTSKLIINSTALDIYPTFANNSNSIAFLSLRDGSKQIWLRDTNGLEKKISNFRDGRIIHKIRWSPNDDFLLSDSNNEIYTLNVQTGEIATIIEKNSFGEVGSAIWSNDGQSVIFSSNISDDWQIYKKNLQTQQIDKLTTSGGVTAFGSTDDKILYFLKAHQTGLWEINLVNNKETLLFNDISDISHNAVFAGTDKIYYYSSNNTMRYYDLLNKVSVDLELTQQPDIPQFSMSKDQSLLIFSTSRKTDSSILLIYK